MPQDDPWSVLARSIKETERTLIIESLLARVEVLERVIFGLYPLQRIAHSPAILMDRSSPKSPRESEPDGNDGLY
jgi:hypothetical protein